MKTIEECKANIQEFADRFNLIFNEEGFCGLGRECVGLGNGTHYVDYNPIDGATFEAIPEFYSEKLYDIVPEDAYHKHDCLAVLGRGDKAIRQLSEWVDKLNGLGATVVTYDTGQKGLMARLFGTTIPVIKLPA